MLAQAKDWAAIIFGLTGFLISLATLIRSFRASHREAAKDAEQKRQLVLTKTIAAETAILASRRQLNLLRMECLEAGHTDVLPEIDAYIGIYNNQLGQIGIIADEARKDFPADEAGRKKALDAFDQLLLSADKWSDKALAEQRSGQFADDIRATIRARTRLAEVNQQLARKDLTPPG